jgi:hypothetical protein
MDFVHDQLATGRKPRVFTIIDAFSRFSPAIEPQFNFCSSDVVEVLERVGHQLNSGWIKEPSSCRATWTSGRISVMYRSISHALASQPTMSSSNPSMANSERSA